MHVIETVFFGWHAHHHTHIVSYYIQNRIEHWYPAKQHTDCNHVIIISTVYYNYQKASGMS